jgi:hypothetical protein
VHLDRNTIKKEDDPDPTARQTTATSEGVGFLKNTKAMGRTFVDSENGSNLDATRDITQVNEPPPMLLQNSLDKLDAQAVYTEELPSDD